jgi:ATP-dependent helicase/nuclease subunit B
MPVSRHFLTWEQPLLPQAVAYLAAGWEGTGPLDLSRFLVVVPTRQSGRRLREALAEHAAGRNQAAWPPRVVTPEGLIAPASGAGVASRLQSLLAWVEIFRALEPAEYREVFPIDPPARNFSWALRLAEQFLRLQTTLAEGGWRIADVIAQAGEFPEAARWRQLGELEQRQAGQLAAAGLRGMAEAAIAAADDPPPISAERIVVLAVPDPLPLATAVLAAHARRLPVEIVIFAPEAEAEAFDDWGRPRAAVWRQRELALAEFASRVNLEADPSAQAERIAALVGDYALSSGALGSPSGRLSVGVADPEVLPLLESALARSDIPVFNPEGRPRRGERLYHLLAALGSLAQEPSFEGVAALARCPDFVDYLGARGEGPFSAAAWLEGLDELRSRHLPSGLEAARGQAPKLTRFPELVPGLQAIDEIRAKLLAGPFAAGAAAAVGDIFSARKLDLAREWDARLQESADAWRNIVRECGGLTVVLSTAEWWELALRIFGDGQTTDEKPDRAIELQGWLELLFEDAPHLVVAGMNDGCVPEAVARDAFLPEALREKLGLKTDVGRLARDAYVLSALDACRRAGGRLDLLFGKVSAIGDPLRPSRLLLQGADAALPARVKLLFRPIGAGRPGPAWTRAWRLQPPGAPRLERIRVTAFRDYLQCPFRFYLRHALDLSRFDAHKTELDAPDFGTLCHSAFEAMAREPGLRDSVDAAQLRAFLHQALERELRARYGSDLTLPLLIQLESARQRLARAAEVQAEQRAEGWIIEEAEKSFFLPIGPIRVNGKIDRIERHAGTGERRVLDYKTSDRPLPPRPAHVRRPGRDESATPGFARFTVGGEEWIWTDLQLPLYLAALGREGGPVTAGYFNLPKAAGDTAVSVWDGYDDAWRAAAARCAEGVAAAIAAGVFWPPAELEDRPGSLFDGWFHRGTAASVEPNLAPREASELNLPRRSPASIPLRDARPRPGGTKTGPLPP